MSHVRNRGRFASLFAGVAILALAGCATLPFIGARVPKLAEEVGVLAVFPIAPDPGASAERLAPGSERLVTAQIYGALAATSHWRFVADLDVQAALPRVGMILDQASRARALGREVKADTVLFGTVSRLIDRSGSAYGSNDPASVSFDMQLISVHSGEILWVGEFEETQQSLTSNLFNAWQFWRGGPKWFSAAEFTRLGVDRLLDDLHARKQ